ncbi:hypothetical protein RvY_16059 [Ramazzottius varieornatus]|uniref:Uncharacterized protein n=1 Tax=Ramazzottius varieornatus TaxID=947166 RepID=A0A1D1VX45_RAMVA|nr:hypothetical protein RvY_16059 [Ramazzottius varieornatus]
MSLVVSSQDFQSIMDGLDEAVTGVDGEEAVEEDAGEGADAADATQGTREMEDEGDVIDSKASRKKYRKGSGKDVIAFGQTLSQNDRARIWRMYSRLEHFMATRKSRGNMTTRSQRLNAIKYLAGYSESSANKIVMAKHKKQREEERRLQEEFAAIPPEPIEVPRSYIRVFGQPSSLAVSLAQDVAHLAELDAAARLAVNDRQLLGVEQAPLVASDLILPSNSSSSIHPHITDSNGNSYDVLSEFLVGTPGTQSNDAAKRGWGRPKDPTTTKSNKKKRQPSFNKKKGIRTSLTSQRAAGLLPPIEAPVAAEASVEPVTDSRTTAEPIIDCQREPQIGVFRDDGVPRDQDGCFVASFSVPPEHGASVSCAVDFDGGLALEVKRKRGRPLVSSKKNQKAAVKLLAATTSGPEVTSGMDTDGVVQEKRGRGRPPGSGKAKPVVGQFTASTNTDKRGRGSPRGSKKARKSRDRNLYSWDEEAPPEIDGTKMSIWERALVDPLMISRHTAPSVISSLMDTTMNAGGAGSREVMAGGDRYEEDVMEWGSYNVRVMNAAMYADSLASCTFLPS